MQNNVTEMWEGTAAELAALNLVLAAGCFAKETDQSPPKYKQGDGVTDYNTLPYFGGGSGGGVTAVDEIDGSVKVDNTDPTNPKVGLPYLVYTALLTQSGTDAPVATILQNTLGATPLWEYGDTGFYTLTLAGAFPADKTFYTITQNTGDAYVFLFGDGGTPNVLSLETLDSGSDSNALLNNTPIEIRVYS